MRRPLIIANWKLHKGLEETKAYADRLKGALTDEPEYPNVDLAICPPFPLIHPLSEMLRESPVAVGAQNVSIRVEGAFTGEVGINQLKDTGAQIVILGHSERRNVFNETDDLIAEKLALVLTETNLTPVLCVGESLQVREKGEQAAFTTRQLESALHNVSDELAGRIVIAYEPIWAIGTGVNATPGDAQAMCKAIRQVFAARFGENAGSELRILYGGSIKPANWRDIFAGEDVDGGLVGGASLDATDFFALYQIALGS
ncbi:triose-phosphate isomerase [bacterium]|nr:triose-phosphate isomerase [bacterium]